MRNVILAASLLLSFPFAAPAGATAADSRHRQTYRGCLLDNNGIYLLKTSKGKLFQLTGDTTGFSALVGRELSITGNEGRPIDLATGIYKDTNQASTNHGTSLTLRVGRATKVADVCAPAKGATH